MSNTNETRGKVVAFPKLTTRPAKSAYSRLEMAQAKVRMIGEYQALFANVPALKVEMMAAFIKVAQEYMRTYTLGELEDVASVFASMCEEGIGILGSYTVLQINALDQDDGLPPFIG
jgi:hypothetical protein